MAVCLVRGVQGQVAVGNILEKKQKVSRSMGLHLHVSLQSGLGGRDGTESDSL